ncbi:hypothetical protein FQN60_007178 [Etheostoma spectabile]|uniref:TRC8-like N-terminal domain-containing protein n=1 Tax=Etheostoma spectabile TaxID=54343 RepID=A0A5J5CBZ8_9PERO|nr:hypothetical protein FQN60_007178 [Etheostoma spectabile]
MPRLEELANVALRVPSLLVLDLLYKCDIEGLTEHIKAKNEDMLFKYKYVIWNMYYIGHLINVVVLVLPLRHIVMLYLHILAAMLLYMGHQVSKDYVREELQYGFEGAVYLDSLAFNRFVSAMTSQIILSTLCAFLMKTRKVWLFSAHMLPLLARLCAAHHTTLLTVNTLSMGLTGAGITVFLLSHVFVPYRLAKAAYSELLQLEVIELYRLLAVGISLWNQFAVPVLFSVFWFVLFIVQLFPDTMSGLASAGHQGIMFFLLTSVSECCATPYSLLGLTFVVSYLALGLLNLCKFYLGGYAGVQNDNVMHRGVTEGVTLLLLALQTGLLDMQALQRTFLLSIILFIVVTSTLQSMIEITDPVILALGASRNRSVWKHFRGLSMCLLLLVFPVFMAYKISQFFHMDFWLLILVSSCMLTSLQVTGTMLIYSLFMVELFRSDPIESLDEVIYWVNAVSRVLEFVVALCVVAYGTWESLFGEWSWMGASVIIIHSYFNWLYVQETCPMCHQTVRPTLTGQSPASGDTPAAPTPIQRDTGPNLAAQEGDQNPDNGTSQETPSDATTPDPTEEREETKSFEDGDCGCENKDKSTENNREAVQGLCFSSSGDFVGFVSPVSSCSSGGNFSSHVPLGKKSPLNMANKGEESGKDSPLPSSLNEYTVESQSDTNRAELEDISTFSPRVAQNANGNNHNSCEGTSESWNSFDSPESNKKHEASGVSLVDSPSVKSCNENSGLLDCIDDPPNHKGNNTYSDLDLDGLREVETVSKTPRLSSSEASFSCTSTDNSN